MPHSKTRRGIEVQTYRHSSCLLIVYSFLGENGWKVILKGRKDDKKNSETPLAEGT